MIENVPGFARGRNAATPLIEDALHDINRRFRTAYRLDCRVLNAADYGVPQRRERAVMIALRDGQAFRWPRPSHEDRPTRAWDAIGGMVVRHPPEPQGKWADLLPSIPEGWNYLWHTDHGDGQPLFGYRTRFWSFLLKLAKSEPAWTLPAQPAQNAGPFHWDNRPLSAREMLRLQSFPASWRLRGSHAHQVRQAGNATPPLLAEVIGRSIGEQVFDLQYRSRPKLTIARRRQVPAAEMPTRVPQKYRELEGDHDPHPGAGKGPSPVLAARGI